MRDAPPPLPPPEVIEEKLYTEADALNHLEFENELLEKSLALVGDFDDIGDFDGFDDIGDFGDSGGGDGFFDADLGIGFDSVNSHGSHKYPSQGQDEAYGQSAPPMEPAMGHDGYGGYGAVDDEETW